MAQRFRMIGGRRVPIGSGGGGGAVAAAALAAVVALGAAGGGVAAGGAVGGVAAGGGTAVSGGAAGEIAEEGAQLGRAVSRRSVNSGRRAARRGQHDEAWRRLNLRSVRRSVRQRLECAVHSYGDVQQFFLRTPCRDLDRLLFVVGDDQGDTLVVSVSWVRMRNTSGARKLTWPHIFSRRADRGSA